MRIDAHRDARPAGGGGSCHAATLERAKSSRASEELIAELETTKTSERAGRVMDHDSEDAFERLRAKGYM